jgi:hypothetical protein
MATREQIEMLMNYIPEVAADRAAEYAATVIKTRCNGSVTGEQRAHIYTGVGNYVREAVHQVMDRINALVIQEAARGCSPRTSAPLPCLLCAAPLPSQVEEGSPASRGFCSRACEDEHREKLRQFSRGIKEDESND